MGLELVVAGPGPGELKIHHLKQLLLGVAVAQPTGAVARDSVEAYFHSMSLIRDADRSRLYSRALKLELGGYNARDVFTRHAANAGTEDPLALIQYIDTHTYLVGDINTKVDRASMAHSFEVR